MRREVIEPGRALRVALSTFACVLLSASVRGETLEEALVELGADLGGLEDPNLSARINRAVLDDDGFLGLAYRVVETADRSERLGESLFLLLRDKASRKWKRAEIEWTGLHPHEGICHRVDGSPIHFLRFGDTFFVECHLSPSASGTVVLTKDLAVLDTLCGWVVGGSPTGTVVYQHSQVHFAATHSAEVSIYDPRTRFRRQLYPWKPLGEILETRFAAIRRAEDEIGKDWFRVHNHPMDPERPKSDVSRPEGGAVAFDEATGSVAFILSFPDLDTWDAAHRLKAFYFSGMHRAFSTLERERPVSEEAFKSLHAVLWRIGESDLDRDKSLGLLSSEPEIRELVKAALEKREREIAGREETKSEKPSGDAKPPERPKDSQDAKAFFTTLDPKWEKPDTWLRLRDLVAVPPATHTKVVLSYRNVVSEEGATCRERLLPDERKRLPGLSNHDILEALVKEAPPAKGR